MKKEATQEVGARGSLEARGLRPASPATLTQGWCLGLLGVGLSGKPALDGLEAYLEERQLEGQL